MRQPEEKRSRRDEQQEALSMIPAFSRQGGNAEWESASDQKRHLPVNEQESHQCTNRDKVPSTLRGGRRLHRPDDCRREPENDYSAQPQANAEKSCQCIRRLSEGHGISSPKGVAERREFNSDLP